MKLNFLISSSARNQYIAVLTANIVSLSQGSIVGWLSPALLLLNSDKSPLDNGPLTVDQVSWLSSVVFIGSLIGVIVCGKINQLFGSKISLICIGLPQFAWWGLIYFGNNYYSLVIGRVFVGFSNGAVIRVIPQYVAEISQKEIRGTLASISLLMFNKGNLLGFILGNYIPYELLPWSSVMPVLYILIITFFIPESPSYLLSKGKKEEALRSLLFYRTVKMTQKIPESVLQEFKDLETLQSAMKEESKVSWQAFCSKEAKSGLAMATFLSVFVQCTGLFLITQYTAPLFVESGSNLHPNDAAIVVALLQILGNYVSVFLVDRTGRKILLIGSTILAAFSLSSFGLYSFLDKATAFEVIDYNWIPVATLSFAIFLMSIGLNSVSFVLLTEVLPPEIKSVGLTIANVAIPLVRFPLMMMVPQLMVSIKIYGVMWFFAGSCVVGVIITAIFLKETKGKNLNKLKLSG